MSNIGNVKLTREAKKEDSKKDDARASSLNMATIATMLDEHRVALSAEFRAAFATLDNKFDNILTTVRPRTEVAIP